MPWSPKYTREYLRRYRQENAEELNVKAREYYAKNKEKRRAASNASSQRIRDAMTPEQKAALYARQKINRIKRQYNLTPDQWQTLFQSQGQRCATCRVDDPGVTGWATDHCHETLRVRGILCPACNKALGLVKDDPTVLAAMITYLAKDKP